MMKTLLDISHYVMDLGIEFAGMEATIDESYIKPEHRRKGLGTEVLECIKVKVREDGINALHLEVARTNTKARNLYSRAGFTPRERYTQMSIKL